MWSSLFGGAEQLRETRFGIPSQGFPAVTATVGRERGERGASFEKRWACAFDGCVESLRFEGARACHNEAVAQSHFNQTRRPWKPIATIRKQSARSVASPSHLAPVARTGHRVPVALHRVERRFGTVLVPVPRVPPTACGRMGEDAP